QFVLTRLHARYGKNALGEDLVFREAPPIVGGRESEGRQSHGAEPSSTNNFQGRYVIRHPWTGPIACEAPRPGKWGGPPSGVSGDVGPKPATNLAFAPRGRVNLASFVSDESLRVDGLAQPAPPTAPFAAPPPRGCGACEIGQ